MGKVGRHRSRARLAMAVLYICLTLGAVTTVFPFMVMVTTGFKGVYDQNDNRVIPRYWKEDQELLAKYLDDKYAGNIPQIAAYRIGPESDTETIRLYEEFLRMLPPDQWLAGFRTPANNITSKLNTTYQKWLRKKYGNVASVNKAYNEINGAFQQITPPPEKLGDGTWSPKENQKWRDWMEFKSQLDAEYRIPLFASYLFQEYVRIKYANQFADVPPEIKGDATKFEEIPLQAGSKAYQEFALTALPKTFLVNRTIEDQWSSYSNKPLPHEAYENSFVREHERALRSEFTWRNYRFVLDYIAIHGKALLNTVIFVGLAIFIQLTVNPLAAYALSRYPMKTTGKILLFLLATMAFPAEVAMIPSFLLLKNLGLLNTFAALVLPTAASGYMIFLLKGFFDSLPREVFESAEVDGAPEWLVMLRIAFPLSKPVFGYMALLAFMGAYGAFLYAFLVAQDRDMWTLMVFVYQLQTIAPKSIVLAATTLVALPTLLVFLAAQRVIMRGIVLPGER